MTEQDFLELKVPPIMERHWAIKSKGGGIFKETISGTFVFYKGDKHWVIKKIVDEGLLIIDKDSNGICSGDERTVRYENAQLN